MAEQRPLTRREIRERERRAQEQAANAAAQVAEAAQDAAAVAPVAPVSVDSASADSAVAAQAHRQGHRHAGAQVDERAEIEAQRTGQVSVSRDTGRHRILPAANPVTAPARTTEARTAELAERSERRHGSISAFGPAVDSALKTAPVPGLDTVLPPVPIAGEGDGSGAKRQQPGSTPTANQQARDAQRERLARAQNQEEAERRAAERLDASAPMVSSPATASVLVLPDVPRPDITRPLDATGEVVLTGSITLPQVTSNTGVIPSVFEKDRGDPLADTSDAVPITDENRPVSAAEAVRRYEREPILPVNREQGILRRSAAWMAIGAGVLLLLASAFVVIRIVRG